MKAMTTKTYYVFSFTTGTGAKSYFSADFNGNKFEPLSGYIRLEDLVTAAKKHEKELDIPDVATVEQVRKHYCPPRGIEPITLSELMAAEKSLSSK